MPVQTRSKKTLTNSDHSTTMPVQTRSKKTLPGSTIVDRAARAIRDSLSPKKVKSFNKKKAKRAKQADRAAAPPAVIKEEAPPATPQRNKKLVPAPHSNKQLVSWLPHDIAPQKLNEQLSLVEEEDVLVPREDHALVLVNEAQLVPVVDEAQLEPVDEAQLVPMRHDMLSNQGIPVIERKVLLEVRCVRMSRTLSNPTEGNPDERADLGWGDIMIVEEGGEIWYEFWVEDDNMFRGKRPPFATAHEYMTGNAGKQNMFLIDQVDVSEFHVNGPFYRRWGVEFLSRTAMDGFLAISFGKDAVDFLDEFYDQEGRFVRHETLPDHGVVNENAMNIDEINGHPLLIAPRPLEIDEYGEIIEYSQGY